MPLTGYLTEPDIRGALRYITNHYAQLTDLINLPETSFEGRSVLGIKISFRDPRNPFKPGLLFIGGVHARELVPPDLLLSFAVKLCQAFMRGGSLKLGGKTYSFMEVQRVVHGLDLFVLPMVNPDGRVFVQTPPPTGDAWWRKNRRPNACSVECIGVDINRNYDFLFLSGIGTSTDSCSDVFKGCAPFSESETRNVLYLLDNHPNIVRFVDIHSPYQMILCPWGDDDNQTTDPSMNFMNPQYDGLRGERGDTLYKEYIPAADREQFAVIGARVSAAIATMRGTPYPSGPSAELIGFLTANGLQYTYSRHFVDPQKRKVLGMSLELGGGFQPDYQEALNIISEVSAGLMEFCLEAASVRIE